MMAVRLESCGKLGKSTAFADDIQQTELNGPNSIPKIVALEIAFVV